MQLPNETKIPMRFEPVIFVQVVYNPSKTFPYLGTSSVYEKRRIWH